MNRTTPLLFFVLPAFFAASLASAREFSSRIISPTNALCRMPAGDADFVAWQQYTPDEGSFHGADIVVWSSSGGVSNLTDSMPEIAGRTQTPAVCGRSVAFIARYSPDAPPGPDFSLAFPPLSPEMKAMEDDYPTLFGKPAPIQIAFPDEEASPDNPEEVAAPPDDANDAQSGRVAPGSNRRAAKGSGASLALWQNGNITRLTPDTHDFQQPVLSDSAVVALCPRGWPYGYELVSIDRASSRISQLTTNFFYVQHPRLHGSKLVYQCWDGNDDEIYLADLDAGTVVQITDNTFDDIEPDVWDDLIAWTAHPLTTSEIFVWQNGSIRKISQNSVANSRPSVWNGHVVWQGMASDATDFDIFYNDGSRTVKLTSNIWDDLNPRIRNGIIAWESFVDLGDSEVMALDIGDKIPVQLSNSNHNDHSPVVCGESVVWQTDTGETSYIQLATPTSPRAEPKPAEEDGAAAN